MFSLKDLSGLSGLEGNIDEKWIDVGGGFNDLELCNYVGQLWPIVQWIKVD